MGTAVSPTNGEKKKEDDKKKKLTKHYLQNYRAKIIKYFEYLQIMHIDGEESVKIVRQRCYDI
jgi:hypothetical protein